MTLHGREDAYIDSILRWQSGERFPVERDPSFDRHTFNQKALRAALGALAGDRDELLELALAPQGTQGELGVPYFSFRSGAWAIGAQVAEEVGDPPLFDACTRRLDGEFSFLELCASHGGRVVAIGDRCSLLHDIYADGALRWVKTGNHGLRPGQWRWQDSTFGIRQLIRLYQQTGWLPNPHRADLIRTARRIYFLRTAHGRAVWTHGWWSTNHTVLAVSWADAGDRPIERLSPSTGLPGQIDTRFVGDQKVWTKAGEIRASGWYEEIDDRLRKIGPLEPWEGAITRPGGKTLDFGYFRPDGPPQRIV